MAAATALDLALRLRQAQHGAAAASAERILAVIGLTNGDLLARIRIFIFGTSLLPGQASRGGAIERGDAMSHRRCRENSGAPMRERHPTIPAVRSIEHPVGRGANSE